MNLILCFISCFLALGLLFKNGVNRLLIFFVGITFLPYGLVLMGKLIAPRLLVFAFILSIIIQWKNIRYLKNMPAKWIMILLFLAHLLTGFFDQRVSLFQGFIKALIVFMETFGGIVLGYLSFNGISRRSSRKIFQTFIFLSFIACTYSFCCLLIGSDPYCLSIGDTDSLVGGRLRSASFFFNSHVAGMAFTVYLLLLLYMKQKMKYNQFQNMILLFLLMAIFFTGSRSTILCLIAGCLVLYYDIIRKSRHKIKIILGFLLVLVVAYLLIGNIIVAKFADAFQDDGGETGGSNVAMRLQQLSFSWDLFLQSPWFGNGFNYFWEYIKVKDNYLSSMLLGAESYIFILLIERGGIQIVLILLYFISLIRYFIQCRTLESYFALSLIVAFLVNSIVTGNLYKWIFVMPLIGYYLHYVEFQIKQK